MQTYFKQALTINNLYTKS